MQNIKQVFTSRRTESPIESKFMTELMKYNVPYETQYEIGKYRIDFAFVKDKVAIEIDGDDYHTSPAQILRDELRDEYLLEVCGWRTKRIQGWFVYRYAHLAVASALLIVPSMQEHALFKHNKILLATYYVRELNNQGHSIKII